MAADFVRDRWGRPLITPADGGKPVAYTRFSSHGQVLEDRFGLEKWKIRTAALGLSARPDLLAQVAACDPDDKQRLDEIMGQALEAGGGSIGANLGTALHEFTQRFDLGELSLADIQEPWRSDVAAYADTLKRFDLTPVRELIEVNLVNDELQLAGTADRFYRRSDGRLVCADLKTGKAIGPNPLAYAVQLTAYAHSMLYDVEKGARYPIGDVDLDDGIIVHLPAQKASCTLYRVDLKMAMDAAWVATGVRGWQKRKGLVQVIPTPEKAVETILEAFPGTVVEDEPTRNDWLRARIIALAANPAAKSDLNALWPEDLPKPKLSATYTDDQIDRIVEIVASLEDTHNLGFFPIDPKQPKLVPEPAPKTVVVKPEPVDEGRTITDEELEEIKQQMATCPPTGLAYINRITTQAADAGHSISLRMLPSQRRYLLASALFMMAAQLEVSGEEDILDAMITHIAPDLNGDTPGAILGRMTIAQAEQLEHLAIEVYSCTKQITIDETGFITFTQGATT